MNNKLTKSIITLGLVAVMSIPVFANTVQPTTTVPITAQAEAKPFLYDMSDVGTIKGNIAVIGGQLVTPQGKGLPNIGVDIRLFKVNSQAALKCAAIITTDSKGFWKANVDLNSAKYFDSYIEGYSNGRYYVGSIEIPKTNNEEYQGWIDGSIEDMVKAGAIKTVMKATYGKTWDIRDNYGNRFLLGNSNPLYMLTASSPITKDIINGTMINQPKLSIINEKKIVSLPGYIPQEIHIYHNVAKPETVALNKTVNLKPTLPIKTTTGKVSIGDKALFENYWILVNDGYGTGYIYIKVNSDGTFKVDNLTGDVHFNVVKVDDTFKQIEAYSPVKMNLKGGEILELDLNPNQYMVKLTGSVAEAILHTNFGPMSLEMHGSAIEGKPMMPLMGVSNYKDGMVIPVSKEATLWLARNGDSKATTVKLNNTLENPVVEYPIVDFINMGLITD